MPRRAARLPPGRQHETSVRSLHMKGLEHEQQGECAQASPTQHNSLAVPIDPSIDRFSDRLFVLYSISHPARPLPHVDYEDRPPCESFARYGACPRGEACWYPHIAMSTKQTAERAKAAILTSRVYARRLAVRAQELLQRLGDGSENVCHIVGHVSALRQAQGRRCPPARSGGVVLRPGAGEGFVRRGPEGLRDRGVSVRWAGGDPRGRGGGRL